MVRPRPSSCAAGRATGRAIVRAPWLGWVALGVIAACGSRDAEGPETTGEEMEVVEVVRDLLADPPEWEVVRAHPNLAPTIEVLSPGLRFERDGADMPSLVLAPPSEVRFPIAPEDGAARLRGRLGIDISALQHLSEALPRATVGFTVLRNDTPAFEGDVELSRDTRPRGSDWLDLAGEEGIEVRPGDTITIRTVARGPDGAVIESDTPVFAGVGGLRLERERSVPRTRSSSGRPNVVLVVMDTLRVDRLSTYGYERETSPVLTGLAERGVLFENAYATSSWTWPSTASILTGLLPQEHGVVRGGACFLPQDIETLAELMQEEGVTTAGWSGNPLIAASRNFQQGFESFRDAGEDFVKTGAFFDEVADWIAERAGTRFFLYLHLTEPHQPFVALDEGLRRFAPDAPADFHARMSELKGVLGNGKGVGPDGRLLVDELVSAEERAWTSDVYDACVWSGDRWLGRLLEVLEAQGLTDETIVAFTSDHGEELFERGFFEHSQSLYGELVRAPLVLAGPGVPAGRRVEVPVSNRRLTPLLAALAGAEFEAGFDPAAFLSRPDDEPILYSTDKGFWKGRKNTPLLGMRVGDRALQVAPGGGPWGAEEPTEGGDARLFDLAADPGERDDLAPARQDETARLRERLERVIDSLDVRVADRELRIGAATQRLLERIGYAGGDD